MRLDLHYSDKNQSGHQQTEAFYWCICNQSDDRRFNCTPVTNLTYLYLVLFICQFVQLLETELCLSVPQTFHLYVTYNNMRFFSKI